MRLFVAIGIGDEARARVAKALEQVKAHSPKSKWVPPENLHVTVAFLGNLADEVVPELASALDAAAARHAALTVQVGSGGAFGGARRPRVLWVGVEGELEPLAKDVEQALVPFGYTPETRKYHPHVTVARARELRGDAGLAECAEALKALEVTEVPVREVLLMKSVLGPKGAKYEVLHRAALR